MLGGGVFVTQNKVMPGAYINFVNASRASSAVGDRGVVAIAYNVGREAGTVLEINREEFLRNPDMFAGLEVEVDWTPIKEIFLHAKKIYLYTVGEEIDFGAALTALEPYEFNVFCGLGASADDIATIEAQIISWRDELGKKCQAVVYNAINADHEGIINVVSTVSEGDADALVAWVAGAEAGCAINTSCTNMLYDGSYKIVTDKTQKELEACIEAGQVAFHLVYGDVRLLEDVNSLTSVTAEKGEDFKYNQTIRVIDQVANDIAKLFNTKYLGKIPNNASGRVALWGDIVAHHRQLEALQAIEAFDSSLLVVEQGATKKSVVVNDAITVINAMSQLYMTIVVS